MAGGDNTALNCLRYDYLQLKYNPLPYVTAEPIHSNIFEWRFVIKCPKNTPLEGYYYYSVLYFDEQFPFSPPGIYVFPVDRHRFKYIPLCFGNYNHDPDRWVPGCFIGSLLLGILNFLIEGDNRDPIIGLEGSEKEDRLRESLELYLRQPIFRDMFPEICQEMTARLAAIRTGANGANTGTDSNCNADDRRKNAEDRSDSDDEMYIGEEELSEDDLSYD